MNQELNTVLSLLVALGVTIGIYLLATYKYQQRRATKLFNTLCNSVWQVNASLRTREWESEHLQSSITGALRFESMQDLTRLVEECNEHRDVAKAWLLAGRVGYATVQMRYDLGLAAVGKFYRSLHRYDTAIVD